MAGFLPARANLVEVAVLLLAAGGFAPACSKDDSTNGAGARGHTDAGRDGSAGTANDSGGHASSSGGFSSGGSSSGGSSSGGSSSGGSSSDGSVVGPDSVTGEQTVTIGAVGGTLTIEGASLVIPPDALAADIAITMRRWKNPLPAPIHGYSPRYEFLPDGTTFKRAVTLTIPFQGGADARVFWSAPAGGWEDHGGTINGATITTAVTHFSSGGAGGSPVCPTQGGNTFCRAFGASWNCCYALTLDPNATTSYCFDYLNDPDHCGGCDEINKCPINQYCQNNRGSSACVTCDPGSCIP